MTELSVFPIPNCVAFPGTVMPLHVFEPRYRKMISDCVENHSLVAVCHTRKVISPPRTDGPVEVQLRSNQATYEPEAVVGAGYCTIHQTLEDGRLYLTVDIEKRYRLGERLQILPYQRYAAEPFDDSDHADPDQSEQALLREKISKRLLTILNTLPKVPESLIEYLESEELAAKTHTEFSFEIPHVVQFGTEISQELIELESTRDRLATLLECLNAR